MQLNFVFCRDEKWLLLLLVLPNLMFRLRHRSPIPESVWRLGCARTRWGIGTYSAPTDLRPLVLAGLTGGPWLGTGTKGEGKGGKEVRNGRRKWREEGERRKRVGGRVLYR